MPPAGHAHPSDVLTRELEGLFTTAARRLEATIQAALRRGLDPARAGTAAAVRGDATAAYRARQLQQARAILAELERQAVHAGPLAIAGGYRAGAITVDRALGPPVSGTFGRVHVGAVQALAQNLEGSLTAAIARAGTNVETVFARADALEQGLPVEGVRGVPFLGRRTDDPWRRIGLDTVGEGLITLDTRRQVTAVMVDRLIREGVADALTGYVDRAGRRWGLDRYAAVVARTTTREAVSRGTVNRMQEGGLDLVTISSHPHQADECTPYDGETFSLSGDTPGYDVLDQLPPFHPNCVHVVTPADANLEAFERELAANAAAPPATPPAPAETPADIPATIPPATTPPPGTPPFGPNAQPVTDAHTLERLEAQRVADAIAGDPGPELGAEEARDKALKMTDRQRNKALNTALGETAAKFIDRAWAREKGLRARILDGELSIDDAVEMMQERAIFEDNRRIERDLDAQRDYGYKRRPIPCFSCGRLKRRPADVCEYCGDDPVPLGVDPLIFNREYGYSSLSGRERSFGDTRENG